MQYKPGIFVAEYNPSGRSGLFALTRASGDVIVTDDVPVRSSVLVKKLTPRKSFDLNLHTFFIILTTCD